MEPVVECPGDAIVYVVSSSLSVTRTLVASCVSVIAAQVPWSVCGAGFCPAAGGVGVGAGAGGGAGEGEGAVGVGELPPPHDATTSRIETAAMHLFMAPSVS